MPKPTYTWAEAIEEVLRGNAEPMTPADIANEVSVRGYREPIEKVGATVRGVLQRDDRFRSVGDGFWDLWVSRKKARTESKPKRARKRPSSKDSIDGDERTIRSMITVKAGSQMSRKTREEVLERDGRECQLCGSKRQLQLDHKYSKVDILDDIVREEGIDLHPSAPIGNALYALQLLKEHPRFRDKRYLRVLCRTCNNRR